MALQTRRQFIRSTVVLACSIRHAVARASTSFLDAPVVKDPAGRLLAPAYVNGHGPYRFMIDTGASHCSIAGEVAARLKLPPANAASLSVHSTTGRSTAPAVEAESFEVGSLRMERLSMPVIASPDPLGVIGANALVDKRLTVNIGAGRLIITSSADNRADDATTLPVQQRFGGLLLADGRVGSVDCKFILDTGAQRSIGNRALARRPDLSADPHGNDPLIVGTPDATVASAGTLSPLPIKIGSETAIDLSIACAQLPLFALWELAEEPAVLLGMDYFSQLASFSIDYRHSTLSMRQERR